MNNLEIKSVSVLDIIKKLFRSGLTKNRKIFVLLVLFCSFRLVDDFFDTVLAQTNYYMSYTAIMLLFGFVITAYLLLTAMDTSKVFCKERLLRSIILPIYQLKTLLALIVRIIPVLLISSLAFSVIYIYFTSRMEIELSESTMLIVIYAFSAIMLFFILPYCFSTYLVVTHDINGFNAVKLSNEIFKKNRKSSIIIFIVFTFIPVIILMTVTALIKDASIYYLTLVGITIVIFFNHFIMANFLKESLTNKEQQVLDIQ